MAVMNDAQLSKDFDGLCLSKGILIFALSSAVIHSIAFSVVLSIYFAQKTIGTSNIDTSCVCLFFNTRACIRNSTANFRVTRF